MRRRDFRPQIDPAEYALAQPEAEQPPGAAGVQHLHVNLLAISRKVLRHNVEHGRSDRITMNSMDRSRKLWVYSRGGEPCRRCATPIEYRKQGPDARGTYGCPRCQPEG